MTKSILAVSFLGWMLAAATRLPSQIDSAVRLNGMDAYGTAAGVGGLYHDSTWEVWMRLPAYEPAMSGNRYVLYRWGMYSHGAPTVDVSNGAAIVWNPCGTTTVAPFPGVLHPGVWHHVAVVITSSIMTLYVDGQPVGQDVSGNCVYQGWQTLLGARGYIGVDNFLKADVDEARISNVPRYSGPFTPMPRFVSDSNTVGLWHFDEGGGSVAHDSSPSGRHFTLQGGYSWIAGHGTGASEPLSATAISTTPTFAGVSGHAMARLPTGETLMFAGETATGPIGQTYTLNGATWTQQFPAATPGPRRDHTLLMDPARQNDVLFGGRNPLGVPLGDTWTWANNQWTLVPVFPAPSPRSGHCMAFDRGSNRGLLFGGLDGSGIALGDMWAWDGAAWTQLFPGTLPPARSQFGMDWDVLRGRLVLYGGTNGSGRLDDLWEWDGSNWIEASAIVRPANSGEHLVWDAVRQKMVMFGGSSFGHVVQDDTWEFSASTASGSQRPSWSRVATPVAPAARNSHVLAFDAARGETLLFGGVRVANSSFFGDTWVFDGASWTQRAPSNSPAARWSARGAYDSARGRVVLFGGYNPNTGLLNDTWEWDGTDWTLRTPATSPTPRLTMGMTYDPQRQRVVLFGGQAPGTTVLGDTWEYDGATWAQVTATGPASRRGATMAYDPLLGETVLFGGGDFTTAFGDTWSWNGTQWTQRNANHAPSPRLSHMEFDPQRGKVVLFGGTNHDYSVGYDDTWEWDGSDWALVALERGDGIRNPGPRDGFAMAYDPRSERIVLHGGEAASGCRDDVWSWNGTGWMNYWSTTALPPARRDHVLYWDAVAEELRLFGGACGTSYQADLWRISLPVYSRWNRYGVGCPGLLGVPVLAVREDHGAIVGQSLVLDLTNCPSTPFNLAFGVFDLQRDVFMGLPIPVDLAGLGLPSCQAWTGGNWSFALPAMTPGVGTSMTVPLPNWPALLGLNLYLQALVFDNSNGRWASLSNGVEARIGSR